MHLFRGFPGRMLRWKGGDNHYSQPSLFASGTSLTTECLANVSAVSASRCVLPHCPTCVPTCGRSMFAGPRITIRSWWSAVCAGGERVGRVAGLNLDLIWVAGNLAGWLEQRCVRVRRHCVLVLCPHRMKSGRIGMSSSRGARNRAALCVNRSC